jgi:cytochrome o ubiquinol oxidase subunit 2
VPLHLRLTSASVLNVFWVPRLGSEIYTMNGMTAQLYLQADSAGVYPGLSGHFSGDGFSDMYFEVHAVSSADFTAWTASTRGNGPTLDDASYRLLLRQSQNVKPYTYGAVAPGLFDAITMHKLPPGDGPADTPSPRAVTTAEN